MVHKDIILNVDTSELHSIFIYETIDKSEHDYTNRDSIEL